jgi:nucleoside-diphosphate-sugar epimerase
VTSLGLRYFNVYGARQHPDSPYSGVISRFMNAYKNEAELNIFGDGTQSRDFIHVSDIAKANVLALDSDYAGMMNIATGKTETLLQLIEYIEQAGGRPAKRGFQPARAGDIKESSATVDLLAEYLRFRAQTPLQEGIRQLINSI